MLAETRPCRRFAKPCFQFTSSSLPRTWRLPMSDLKAAYARMGSRQVRGKLLLVN